MSKTETTSFVVKIILYVLGSVAILLTVLPFIKLDNWWIRIGEFPRVQIAGVCLIVFIFFFFFYRTLSSYEFVFPLLLLICTGYQLYCIIPYTPVYPIQVEQSREAVPEKTIKILISNVFIENKETEKLLNLIDELNPDVVLLAEPDEYWIKNIASIKEKYPYNVEIPLDNAYGMAMYSRLELIKPETKYLVEDDIPSIHTNIKLPSGDVIRFYGVHPRPPIPTESMDSTERDAELVIVGKEVEKLDMPTIIAGDLNDVAWSRTTSLFQKVSGMLDPRIGRGFYNSFHSKHWLIRFPLDHVFHTNDFRLSEIKRLDSIESDHFPIYIALSLETTAEKTQKEPEANAKEEKQANEMIEEAEKEKNEEK